MEPQKIPLEFCRLCGKNVSEVLLFQPIADTKWGQVAIKSCSKCRVVLHNMGAIMNDFVQKKLVEDQKIAGSVLFGPDGAPMAGSTDPPNGNGSPIGVATKMMNPFGKC